MKRTIIAWLGVLVILALLLFFAFSPWIFRDTIAPEVTDQYNWQPVTGTDDQFEIELTGVSTIDMYQEGQKAIVECRLKNEAMGIETVSTSLKLRVKIKRQ